MRINRVLQGNKVALRDITLDDAQQCVDWLTDPDITRYMITQAQTLESEIEWIRKMLASGADLVVRIMVPCDNGEMRYVGNCGLHHIDREKDEAECGIFIGETSLHGQGIGRDAARTLIRFAFTELGLKRIWAQVYAPNVKSLGMVRGGGARQTGTLHQHLDHAEGKLDVHMFEVRVEDLTV